MQIDRPDLDDYSYLAKGLPLLGLALIVGVLRYQRNEAGLVAGLSLGLLVGLALVAVLVVQMHMWKELVARTVVEEGNPRLPVGFSLAVLVYAGGLVGVEVLLCHLYANMEGFVDSLVPALIAGAFLPWALLHWPMQEIRDRADVLYRARSKRKFHEGGNANGDGDDDLVV